MSELDDFLAEVREAGTRHSDGTFTVSLQTAEEKLQRFTLTRPELYIVQLAAAAVASGASFLDINTTLSEIELLSDGQAPSKEQLETLNSFLFYTYDAPEYLNELAVGVQGALSYPAKKVVVESFHQDQAWQLEVREDKQRLLPLQMRSPITPLLRVVVDKGFGLSTRLTDTHPEQEELPACRFAPLELTFDKKTIARLEQDVPEQAYAWAELGPCKVKLNSSTPALLKSRVEKASGYLYLRPTKNEDSPLRLIVNGVEFSFPARWGPSNLSGMVWVEGLRKDISRSALVESQGFTSLTQQLSRIGWELLVEFCREPELTREIWYPLQGVVSQALGHADLLDEHRKVLRHWITVASVGIDDDQGPAAYLHSLQQARELHAEGQERQARQLRNEVLRRVRERMVELQRPAGLEAMAELVEPLRQALVDLESPQLARGLQARDIIHALLGRAIPTEEAFRNSCRWGVHRLGLLLRYQGQSVKAAEVHAKGRDTKDKNLQSWAYRYCAEIELANANYTTANQLLQKAHELLPEHRDLAEERAFLLRLVSPDARRDSVNFLRKAIPEVEQDPFVQWLLYDWLARDAESVYSWAVRAEYRARASLLEVNAKLRQGFREEVESRLDHRFDLLGWQSLKQAREDRAEALEIAETEFGPLHPYTQFSRRRAVYQLYRLEAHQLADRLQCRGHLWAQLHVCLQGVLDTEG